MEPLRIHIYDDEASNVEKWAAALRNITVEGETFDVRGLSTDEFADTLRELDARRDWARKDDPTYDGHTGDPFDLADILVLDYDLFTVGDRRDLTGEEVAYLARCYSHCGILIALNQGCRPDSNPFHLDLRQHPDSWADVNCSSTQFGNPGLWGPRKAGLRPWYWPSLPRAVRDFRRCLDELRQGALDQPVLAWLGLDTEHVGTALTPPLLKHIVPQDQKPETMTFRNLAKYHLRPKDREWTDAVPRIAAATARAWLAQAVLPPQNILVDAPHMVSRFPSLLMEDSPVGWDRTAQLWPETGAGIDERPVSPARFEKSHWLSRPVWYWQRLTDLDLPELRDPWGRRPSERVFCEEVSRFLPKQVARRYHSGLSPEFLNRWVVDPATPEGESILGRAKVDYEPAWLLMV